MTLFVLYIVYKINFIKSSTNDIIMNICETCNLKKEVHSFCALSFIIDYNRLQAIYLS